MRIRFSGTSSAIPAAHSGFTSFLVEAGGRLGMVDMGDNPARAVLEAGADPVELAFVVLTHRHADHLGAFPALIASLDCLVRREPLEVVASADAADDTRQLLGFFGLLPPTLSFPLRYVTSWAAGTGSLDLLDGNHSVPTSMVRIREDSTGLLYTADCVFDPDLAAANAAGCAVLIHEATCPDARLPAGTGHSSARQAGRAATAAGVKRLFLCHLDPIAWRGAGDPAAEARRVFAGEVIVPEPGTWYSVTA
jgi:ribonuclease BN (tRNA processing enzyme)